jgi:hypothetical protein
MIHIRIPFGGLRYVYYVSLCDTVSYSSQQLVLCDTVSCSSSQPVLCEAHWEAN